MSQWSWDSFHDSEIDAYHDVDTPLSSDPESHVPTTSTEYKTSSEDDSVFSDIAEVTIERPGMYFETVTSTRIKISFKPSKISYYFLKETTYSCTLRYNGKYWTTGSVFEFPVSHLDALFNLFKQKDFSVRNENLWDTLVNIYEIFNDFIGEVEQWRHEKYQRYKEGDPDMFYLFDETDEQIFLSPAEIEERTRKKWAILKRMIPPERNEDIGYNLRR